MIIKKRLDTIIHLNMSLIGGFFGGYAISFRHDIFGSAQTANLIKMLSNIVHGNFYEAMILFGAFVIYAEVLILACVIPHYVKYSFRSICVVIEFFAIIVIGLLPKGINDAIALYPMFAITAFQWSFFTGNREFNSATIFSTNNIKQTIIGAAEYLRTGDEKQKRRFSFYGRTILFFYMGVVLGILSVILVGEKGIWICDIAVLSAYVLVRSEKKADL